MDDKKMKIRVVVQPEETRRAAEAAEREREAQVRRRRWGLLALSGLVAAGLIAALVFFLTGEDETSRVADSPAPASSSTASSSTASSPTASSPTASSPTAAAPSERQATPPLGASLAEGPGSGASDGAAGAGNGQAGEAASGQGSATAPDPGMADSKSGGPGSTAAPAPATGGSVTPGSGGAPSDNAPAPANRPPAASPQPPQSSPQQPPQTPPTPAPTAAPAPGAPAMAPTPAPASKGAARASQAKQSTSIARAQLTSRVVGREPVDTLRSPVDARSGRDVYYFTEFRDLGGHTVAHRWEHEGEVLATIPFKIGGDRWRVYSSKRVWPNQTGQWRVSAVDKNGTVLATSNFVVK